MDPPYPFFLILSLPSFLALSFSCRSSLLPFPPPSSILHPSSQPSPPAPQDRRPQTPTDAPAALLDGVIFTWPPLTLPAGCRNARVCALLSALPSRGLGVAPGLLQLLLKNSRLVLQFLYLAYKIFSDTNNNNNDDDKNKNTTTFELLF